MPARERDTLLRLGVPMHDASSVRRVASDGAAGGLSPRAPGELVIEALLGDSLRGDPREPAGALIRRTGQVSAPVLFLDPPSGVEATSGRIGGPAVVADATLALALPRAGLLHAPDHIGALFLADISVPPVAHDRPGIEVDPPFRQGTVLSLEVGTDGRWPACGRRSWISGCWPRSCTRR